MKLGKILGVALFGAVLSSCNSNDDLGKVDIEIPGVTFDGDIDCCSAEEALQVYKFIQTVKIIPDLSTEIDGKYNVYAYSKTGSFHVGYNDIYFVVTKKKNGNYVKNFEFSGITPHMLMVKMNMKHSTPVSAGVESFNDNYLAVKHGWISFVMATSDAGSWTLKYDYSILGSTGTTSEAAITVDALPAGQQWVKSFKAGENTYYISLVNPTDWKTGKNAITAGGGELLNYSQFGKVNFFANAGLRLTDTDVLETTFIFDRATDVGYPALNMDVSKAQGLITSLSYKHQFCWPIRWRPTRFRTLTKCSSCPMTGERDNALSRDRLPALMNIWVNCVTSIWSVADHTHGNP